jgi:hypothetical protein
MLALIICAPLGMVRFEKTKPLVMLDPFAHLPMKISFWLVHSLQSALMPASLLPWPSWNCVVMGIPPGNNVLVGMNVSVGMGVRVGVLVGVLVTVDVAVGVAVGVGGFDLLIR